MTHNIVQFPTRNNPDDEKVEKIEELVASYSKAFMDMFDEAEIGEDTDIFYKDYSYFIEAFRSILWRDYGLEHPFHYHTERCFDVVYDDTTDEFEVRWVLDEEETNED